MLRSPGAANPQPEADEELRMIDDEIFAMLTTADEQAVRDLWQIMLNMAPVVAHAVPERGVRNGAAQPF